jgi:hypothetical protein
MRAAIAGKVNPGSRRAKRTGAYLEGGSFSQRQPESPHGASPEAEFALYARFALLYVAVQLRTD